MNRTNIVHFSPETMLQSFLDGVESFAVLEVVEVSKHAENAREAVHLADVEELENLHFETKAGVDHEKHLKNNQIQTRRRQELICWMAFEPGQRL